MSSQDKIVDSATGEVVGVGPEEEVESPIVNGEWLDRPPTIEETMAFLERQGPTGTVHVKDYAAFIVPLSQNKKMQDGKYRTAYHLYMTVAGRVRMFNDDCAAQGATSLIEPDPAVSPPGWIYQSEERLVYRVRARMTLADDKIATRYGTAWVPWVGGSRAVETNRYEKAETSATGRALAAFGYGVLPGSGIASYEEVYGAAEQVEKQEKPKAKKRTKDELIAEVDEQIAILADARGEDPLQIATNIADWVSQQFHKDIAAMADSKVNEGKGDGVWWRELKDGELTLIINQLKQKIVVAKTD